MKRWQIIVLVVTAAIGGGCIVAFPPGEQVIVQEGPQSTTIRTPLPTSRTAVLLFVGDIMLSRSVGDMMAAQQDWRWPFERIASTTAAADLTFGNLETTVSARGKANGCTYCFRANPRAVTGLTFAGFDALSVANNHVWDYGPEAFADTLANVASAGIAPVGSRNARPIVLVAGSHRVAYLAYTNLLPASACTVVSCYESERMRQDIVAARNQADIVVVSFHTGTEYETLPNATQQRIYRAAIDAGADLVIGHHPHVVQPVEHYMSGLPAGRQGWIAYSLGNFVFDQNFSAETMRGLMLTATLTDAGIVSVATRSIDISRQYQPSLSPQ